MGTTGANRTLSSLTYPVPLYYQLLGRPGGRKINKTHRASSLWRCSLQDSKIMALREEIEEEFLKLISLSSDTNTAHSRTCLLHNLHCDAQH